MPSLPVRPASDPLEDRILVLTPIGRDGQLTQKILASEGLASALCADVGELVEQLARGVGAVLVAEEALAGPAFSELSGALAAQPPWSEVPLIIFLSAGQINQARMLLLHGIQALRNATYLERPGRVMTLISTLRAALAARRRQYEVRDHLIERERAAAELAEAYQLLQESDQRKDQFLALLGHELRNPLAAISSSIQMLRRTSPVSDRLQRSYSLIDRQTRHLALLVDDLLDVARVTAGKIILKREPLELGELAERCRQTVLLAARAQHQSLHLVAADRSVWVEGDAVRLEQVVVNLLTNAVKYTPPGGAIVVTVGVEAGEAVIRVRDNGLGIAAEMLPHLFELFSQAPRTLDRAQGGLGIGLTLVRTLVEMHGGHVEARSEGAGQGSVFILALPLRAAPPPVGASAPAVAPKPASAVARRIVVVEDNCDIRESLQELLEDMGHHVDAVGDGKLGVARILAGHPDVALVDIGLPGIDGYEVARQVRAAQPDGILLVAMTGYGQPEDRRRSLAAGFDAHLTKPPALTDLQSLLARAGGN